jgi:hypothetical protein
LFRARVWRFARRRGSEERLHLLRILEREERCFRLPEVGGGWDVVVLVSGRMSWADGSGGGRVMDAGVRLCEECGNEWCNKTGRQKPRPVSRDCWAPKGCLNGFFEEEEG